MGWAKDDRVAAGIRNEYQLASEAVRRSSAGHLLKNLQRLMRADYLWHGGHTHLLPALIRAVQAKAKGRIFVFEKKK